MFWRSRGIPTLIDTSGWKATEGRPKNKNAPTGVGAQFLTVISILHANEFVKRKSYFFYKLTKWLPFNILMGLMESNLVALIDNA